MNTSSTVSVEAEPYVYEFNPAQTALLIIDMQRDFLEAGGFGEMLGNDVSHLRRTIEPNRRLLAAWRKAGLQVIHTREGHRPDLSDLPPAKKQRGRGKMVIGDAGPMGRILVRGEPGHDIIPELYPLSSEPIIDKPGKGAFFGTDLQGILQNRGIRKLVVTGVTTEVCVNKTVREANDRGYDCLVAAAGTNAVSVGFDKLGDTGVLYRGLEVLGGGAILAGLILGAIAVFIIDRQFIRASVFAMAGAALAFFGFIHGEKIGFGQSPVVALSYLAVAVVLLVCSKFSVPVPNGIKISETISETHAELPEPAK
jgi:nicotinamidase-related amidase